MTTDRSTKLPEDFKTYTKELMGENLFNQLMKGIDENATVSIRLNPFKCSEETVLNEGTTSEIIPWCPSTGKYLSERKNFTFDPLFHAGLYYVQEASSMIVDLAIRQYVKEPVTMLDLCAAPGGKSTCVRAALPAGSLLFSNDPMKTRAQILSENIQKFGHPDVVVTNNYPKDYKKSKLKFDVILADVPCSGEGMFRKDEEAITEWSKANVNNCWKLQREIVSDIWNCLKPGGILIYSTCTFNAHEDEENVDWIKEELGAEILPLDIEKSWNITKSLINDEAMYHFFPGISRGEGLFIAVLRKNGRYEGDKKKKNLGKKNAKGKTKEPFTLKNNWLRNKDEWNYTLTENDVYAISKKWTEAVKEANQSLRVLHEGIKIGSIKGKDLIPAQSLALSTELDKTDIPQVELSYEDAINYLRKEAITLPPTTPKGYMIVTYQKVPLGWMKNIGNRANNLYPQEWKIKSSHIPEGDNHILKCKSIS